MDNNNQNNGYTNFNNYQPTPENQQQSAPQPNQVPPQMPYQQPYPYQTAPVQEKNNKGLVLGIISIVLSAIGCFGCAFFTTVPAAILGLIGVIRNKKSVVSWIGLVLGVLASIAWIAYFVYVFSNPDMLREVYEQSGIYSEEQIEMMMDALYGILVNRLG